MGQLVSLLSLGLFALLAQKALCVCFGIKDKKYDKAFAVSFFLISAAAYAEFTYKSIFSGTFYDGELLSFIPDETGVLGYVKNALSSVNGINDIFLGIGAAAVGISAAISGNIIFYPFIFEAFSGAGLALLLAVLAFKYEEKTKLFVVLAVLAAVFDIKAAVLLVYFVVKKFAGKEKAVYIYGVLILLLCAFFKGNSLIFAPVFAYVLDKLSGKTAITVKTASLAVMAYQLVLLWR